jgi:hypothetical protein
MVSIYVLKLENNKFYVGKSNNPIKRLEQHINNSGSAWTNQNKPINIIELIPNCDDFDEDKFTIKYMKQYGINNVRGGSFCQVELDEENINTINKMINGSTDKCYNCGSNEHFANKCKVSSSKISQKLNCSRCDRTGHTEDDCYAKTDKNGEELIDVYCCNYCDKEFETEKGMRFHENVHCKKKNQKPANSNSKNKCFRCGREGHFADDCYAEKHINGKYLN